MSAHARSIIRSLHNPHRMLKWFARSPSPRPPVPKGAFVAFVTYVDEAQRVDPKERLYSNRASARLRVLIPAQQLAQRVPVWLVSPEELASRPDLPHLGQAGAIVLGKLAAKDVLLKEAVLRRLLQNAEEGAARAPLYADLSDDYAALGKEMRQPFLGEYQKALGKCSTFVVPCAGLEQALARYAKRGIRVVEDPYESHAAQAVRAAASSPLRLAWFGSLGSVNLAPLERAFDAIAARLGGTALRLEVVTAEVSRPAVQAMRDRLGARHAGFDLAFTAWSLASTEAAIQRSDFVLLPQEFRSAWGKVKSHNRMVSAIRGGRLALASPIPAYRELAQYGWVGEDLPAGLRWAIAHPDEAARRVAEGQRHVEARFSPEAIGRKWAEALGIPA
jgi:hypothetical protein